MKTMTTSRRNASIGLVGGVVMLALILTGIRAHAGLAASGLRQGAESGQIIKSRVDLITSDVFVRDDKGMFVADLKKEDFEIYEDGVPQSLITLTLSHGGRVFNLTSPPAASAAGIVVPPSRLPNNSGRIFLLFVDDLHLNFMQTGRIRALFKELAERVVHDGDMFGIVSTGPSSLAIDLTYDRKRLNEAIAMISGAAMSPRDIVAAPRGAQGGAEVRHRAHVAFSTAHETLGELERIHDRRKAFIYVSSGYDFDAFSDSRLKQEQERYGRGGGDGSQAADPFAADSYKFGQADLIGELAAVIRSANRANASIYAIDPRGLEAGPDISDNLGAVEWQRHVQTTQDTLRVLADETGGFAIVNQNSFSNGLKRIDAETGDYYVIGYYSSNADPLKRRRAIEIKVKRPRVQVKHRAEYFLRPKER